MQRGLGEVEKKRCTMHADLIALTMRVLPLQTDPSFFKKEKYLILQSQKIGGGSVNGEAIAGGNIGLDYTEPSATSSLILCVNDTKCFKYVVPRVPKDVLGM